MRSGEAFELEVKDLLQKELQSGFFGIIEESARVFSRKAYYSAERRRSLVVDVSIELYRRGATEPYLFWVWECKDTARHIAVDEVEEFHAKLEQIGLHKAKGTIACRRGFQRAALTYARTKGIGLAVVTPGPVLKTILESQMAITRDFVESLIAEPAEAPSGYGLYGISTTRQPVVSVREMLASELSLPADHPSSPHA